MFSFPNPLTHTLSFCIFFIYSFFWSFFFFLDWSLRLCVALPFYSCFVFPFYFSFSFLLFFICPLFFSLSLLSCFCPFHLLSFFFFFLCWNNCLCNSLGCSYTHYYENSQGEKRVAKEVTLRSMMAEFGGFAAQFELAFPSNQKTNGNKSPPEGSAVYAVHECPFETHVAIKVILIGFIVSHLVWVLLFSIKKCAQFCYNTQKQKVG